jgi:integrase
MQIYTDWIGKTPEELLTEAENESKLLMRQRHIKIYLINFRKHLQDTRAPTTVKGYLTGVKSFYKLYDIDLPPLPRSDKKARTMEKNNRVPTKEELQEVLKICDPLEKALILTGAASGLSANELIRLKLSNLSIDAEFITTLELTREKTGVKFCTFLTPESTKAVLDYLEFRNREGKTKRCVQHVKQKVTSENDFIFIKRHIPLTYSKSQDDRERGLDLEALVKIYRGVSTKARKNTPVGTWNFIRSHTIRKYFNSALYNAGCQSWAVEFFMGHEQDATRSAYYRPNPEQLKEIYKSYIPFLTLQKELDFSTSREFLRMQEENKILLVEAEKQRVERVELTKLQQTVQDLQAQQEGLKNVIKIIGYPLNKTQTQKLLKEVEINKKTTLKELLE